METALEANQFLHFRTTPGRVCPTVQRRVLGHGKVFGTAVISVPPGEDEWLCPYFDPVTLTLRFRRRDGQDASLGIELYHLAQHKGYRPLLLMAQAEGLREKIPGAPEVNTFLSSDL